MSTIRFDANVPVEVALKFDTGKQVQSRIPDAPDQMLYTLCGDDVCYLPLHVAEQITKLGIRKMELISICKRVQGKTTKWEVQRVSEAAPPAPPTLEHQLVRSIEQAQQKAQRAPVTTPAAPPQPPQVKGVGQSNSNIQHTRISKIMAAAMIAAVDAIRETERYAAQHGIPVQPLEVEFTAEDIRAISATMFIQASKDPLFLAPQPINGGATWPQ